MENTVNTPEAQATVEGALTEGNTSIAPAVDPNTFKHNFYFRTMADTPANRETLSALGDIEESVSDDEPPKPLIRRATETYTFHLPTISTGNEKQDVVIRELVKDAIVATAKPYVIKGDVPPADKMQWDAIVEARYIAITTSTADEGGSGFNSALLKEIATKFSNYMRSLGKDESGTTIMAKMITGRFSVVTTHKYINGLSMVAQNIEKWLLEGADEEEQLQYADAVEYLLGKLEEAKNPPKVDTGSLF